MLRLVNIHSNAQATFAPTKIPVTIGRATHADVQVDDRFASRMHCELAFIDNQLVVRDLRSRHGTFLNGSPVIEKVLVSGDRLQVGTTTFVVELVAAACRNSLDTTTSIVAK